MIKMTQGELVIECLYHLRGLSQASIFDLPFLFVLTSQKWKILFRHLCSTRSISILRNWKWSIYSRGGGSYRIRVHSKWLFPGQFLGTVTGQICKFHKNSTLLQVYMITIKAMKFDFLLICVDLPKIENSIPPNLIYSLDFHLEDIRWLKWLKGESNSLNSCIF